MATKYDARDPDGTSYEITPGQPFTTHWVVGENGPQAYDVSHPWNALDVYDAEALARFGITATVESDPPPPVPVEVERYKAKIALFAAGHLAAAETAIAGAGPPTTIYWNEAPTFHRNHLILLGIATAINLTSADVDALFIAAAAIN